MVSSRRTRKGRSEKKSKKGSGKRRGILRGALLGLLALGFLIVPDLWAGGTGTTMPWNTPMQTLLNNMTGPTARALVGIATAFAGYKWMFQSHEQGANSMARVTVGGAIALTAQTIISYASFGGALL